MQTAGFNILRPVAIRIVARGTASSNWLVANAGDDAAVVLEKVEEGQRTYGCNAATGEYGDIAVDSLRPGIHRRTPCE